MLGCGFVYEIVCIVQVVSSSVVRHCIVIALQTAVTRPILFEVFQCVFLLLPPPLSQNDVFSSILVPKVDWMSKNISSLYSDA